MADTYLFAYGTLLTGTGSRGIDRILRTHGQDRGRGQIRARLYDLGDYPGAVATVARGDRVTGRLYRLRAPERALARLDRYERFHPGAEDASEFVRRLAEVVPDGARAAVTAWIYYYNRAVVRRPRIASGDWVAWVRRRRNPATSASPGRGPAYRAEARGGRARSSA
jgi:gamma-glutamylcyclotransferase (GGCT)/AIG2-like uncharacterized protein YtfP